jgi:hypothetical protein
METMYAKQEKVRKMHRLERLALIRQRHRKLILETRPPAETARADIDTTTEVEADVDFDLELDLN